MATTTGDANLDALADLIEKMHACVAQAKLYGANHTEARRATTAFVHVLTQVTQWLGTVELKATPEGFIWRGQQVSVEKDDRVGLSRHLHTEGIHSIRFDAGITHDEVVRLLEVLRVNLGLPDYEEETLESLLYQAEFQHFGYRAVAALMEAEALSGRADEDTSEQERRLRSAIELNRKAEEIGQDLGGVLRGELTNMSEADARVWKLAQVAKADDQWEDDEAWRVSLAETEGEDAVVVQQLRQHIATERDSELLARVVQVALRAAAANHAELPVSDAMKIASDAVRQIYAGGDPVGLLRVVDDTHALGERIGAVDPAQRERMRQFLSQHIHPLRIARMLRTLDPSNPMERPALERFLRLLPDAALLALIEGTMRDEDRRAVQLFLKTVYVVSGPKLVKLLADPMRLGPDMLVPVLYLLMQVGAPETLTVRRVLLTHPAAPVREAALQMYDTAIPRDEINLVVQALADRVTSVRRAASETIRRLRPPEATALLVNIVGATEFHALDRPIKLDVCLTLGRIPSTSAISALEQLLNTRTGLMRNESLENSVEAAAYGLAATKNPAAIRILEKGARAWAGAIKQACVDALATVERDA